MADDAARVDRTSSLFERLRGGGTRRRPLHLDGTAPPASERPDEPGDIPGDPAWREPREALSWLRSTTGAAAAAYVTLDLDGWVDSVAAADGSETDLHPRLLARARALFASGDLGYRTDDQGSALTWYANGALRAVLAEKAPGDATEPLARVRSFLQSAESATGGSQPDEARPAPRPRLVEVITDDGRGAPMVTASLEWRGRSLVGSASAGMTEESLHGAAAMAVLRALDSATPAKLRLSRFRLLGTDNVRLFVAAVSVDDRVLTGAAAIEPGEVAAGARAALAALNRALTRP